LLRGKTLHVIFSQDVQYQIGILVKGSNTVEQSA